MCPYCRKVLKNKGSLKRHLDALHLGAKQFGCSECDKRFVTDADLRKHQRATHNEDKDTLVTCNICNEKFRKASINRHRNYKHSSSNLPKYCDVCNKHFKTRETLMKHKRTIHTWSWFQNIIFYTRVRCKLMGTWHEQDILAWDTVLWYWLD